MRRSSSKPSKYEKKNVIFGDSTDEEDNTNHFLGIIRKSLKEALDGLLSAAEVCVLIRYILDSNLNFPNFCQLKIIPFKWFFSW